MKAPTTRLPAIAGRVAELGDRVVQRLGRYQQQLHVLGEMNHTIACDISATRDELGYRATRRAVRRDAHQHSLVRRARLGSVMPDAGRRVWSPAAVDISVRSWCAASSQPVTASASSTSTTPTIDPTGVEMIVGDIRDRRVVVRGCRRRMRPRVQQRRSGSAGKG